MQCRRLLARARRDEAIRGVAERGARIMALHQRKAQMYPEGDRLMSTIPELRIA
jgi:hypothetical protein